MTFSMTSHYDDRFSPSADDGIIRTCNAVHNPSDSDQDLERIEFFFGRVLQQGIKDRRLVKLAPQIKADTKQSISHIQFYRLNSG